MKILEHDHERSLRRDVSQKPRQHFEEAKMLFGSARPVRRLAKLREQAPQLTLPPRVDSRGDVGILENSARADGVDPRAERKDLFRAIGMPDEDLHPSRPGLGYDFLREPRLPDPRLAEDHCESPVTTPSLSHRTPQGVELMLAPDECRPAVSRTCAD